LSKFCINIIGFDVVLFADFVKVLYKYN
jgi:hypothetical protein